MRVIRICPNYPKEPICTKYSPFRTKYSPVRTINPPIRTLKVTTYSAHEKIVPIHSCLLVAWDNRHWRLSLFSRANDPMNGQKADYQVLAHEWVEEFKINEQAANQKYLGRIVERRGLFGKCCAIRSAG